MESCDYSIEDLLWEKEGGGEGETLADLKLRSSLDLEVSGLQPPDRIVSIPKDKTLLFFTSSMSWSFGVLRGWN